MKKIVQTTGHDLDEVLAMSKEEQKNYLIEIEIEEEKKKKVKEEKEVE